MHCAICNTPIDEAAHTHEDQPVCATCHGRIVSYQGQVADRLHRLEARAEKTLREAHAETQKARDLASAIPFGQPILVGHHSERRDRNYRDRIERTYRRGFDKFKKAQQQAERAEAAEGNRAISADNPAAVIELQKKIDAAVAAQELMKGVNKEIRRLNKLGLDLDAKAQELNRQYPLLSVGRAKSLFEPDFAGRIGFPAYALTNNNANIRRMKQRLEELKRQAEQRVQAEAAGEAQQRQDTQLKGVEVERDLDDNRIRIIFPGKPDPRIRAILKQCGFRWSPSNGAWQRQLNPSSEWAVERALKQIEPLWGK